MRKGIISPLLILIGMIVGAGIATTWEAKKVKKQKGYSDKHFALYFMMNQWVRVKQENKSIAEYLERNGYKEIAIYGMSYVGETLLYELQDSKIKVKYAIDKNANNICSGVDIIRPEDDFGKVDAIIVTPITFFVEIQEVLSRKIDCSILSMEDILYEI